MSTVLPPAVAPPDGPTPLTEGRRDLPDEATYMYLSVLAVGRLVLTPALADTVTVTSTGPGVKEVSPPVPGTGRAGGTFTEIVPLVSTVNDVACAEPKVTAFTDTPDPEKPFPFTTMAFPP